MCGWTGLPIRPFPPSVLGDYQTNSFPFYLGIATGSCQEYVETSQADEIGWKLHNASITLADIQASIVNSSTSWYSQCMLSRGPRQPTECNHLFVDTPKSGYCIASPYHTLESSTPAMLCQFFAYLLFILFLVRLRSVVCRTARLEDDSIISTADFSLQISGLDDTLHADVLHEKLYAELEQLTDNQGNFKGAIHHIEVGRHCEEEMKVLHQMKVLDVQAEELVEAKRLAKLAEESTASVDKKMQKVADDFAKTKERLKVLVDEPDRATGHAFVAFNRTKDRDRMARLFVGTPQNLYMFLHPSKVRMPTATLECAAKDDSKSKVLPSCSQLVSPYFWCSCLLNKGNKPVKPAVIVTAAPEPSEVLWENLQVDDEHEAKVENTANILIPLLIFGGLVAIVLMRTIKLVIKDAMTLAGTASTTQLVINQATTVCVSGLTVGWNLLIRKLSIAITKRAGFDTLTREEQAIFGKLSVAYLFNTVGIPLFVGYLLTVTLPGYQGVMTAPSGETFVGSGTKLVDLSWYEDSGVISTMVLLVVITYSADMEKLLPPGAIMKRYFKARSAKSQAQIDELWTPEPFRTGFHYGLTLKSVALGLVYGPIWPPAYLLTSIGMFIAWICTRTGLRHWFERPANVQGDMMMAMRWRLGQVLLLSIVCHSLALASATGPTLADGISAREQGTLPSAAIIYIGAPILVVLYAIIPLGMCKPFALEDELSKVTNEILEETNATPGSNEGNSAGADHGNAAIDAAEEVLNASRRVAAKSIIGVTSLAAAAANVSGVVEDMEDGDDGSGDLSFDEVTKQKGFEMPLYKCPLLDADNLLSPALGDDPEAPSIGGAKKPPSLADASKSPGRTASFLLRSEGLSTEASESPETSKKVKASWA